MLRDDRLMPKLPAFGDLAFPDLEFALFTDLTTHVDIAAKCGVSTFENLLFPAAGDSTSRAYKKRPAQHCVDHQVCAAPALEDIYPRVPRSESVASDLDSEGSTDLSEYDSDHLEWTGAKRSRTISLAEFDACDSSDSS